VQVIVLDETREYEVRFDDLSQTMDTPARATIQK
jgi:hypothetical protein